MVVKNNTLGKMLADNCSIADTFSARFRGLMLKKDLPKGHGLLITPCNSIFIDYENTILHIEEKIKPWKISKIIKGARSVIELPAGTISSTGTKPGDRLLFVQ